MDLFHGLHTQLRVSHTSLQCNLGASLAVHWDIWLTIRYTHLYPAEQITHRDWGKIQWLYFITFPLPGNCASPHTKTTSLENLSAHLWDLPRGRGEPSKGGQKQCYNQAVYFILETSCRDGDLLSPSLWEKLAWSVKLSYLYHCR